MKQRCYLAGPMRGYPEYNFPAFHAAAAKLRAHGLEVWSPAENDVHQDGFDPTKEGSHQPMRHYMKRDLPAVLDADFVAVLPGWEKSQGACLEVHVARTCGIPVYQADTLQPVIPSESACIAVPRATVQHCLKALTWVRGEKGSVNDQHASELEALLNAAPQELPAVNSASRDKRTTLQPGGKHPEGPLAMRDSAQQPAGAASPALTDKVGRLDELPDIIHRARALDEARNRGDAFGKFPPSEALALAWAVRVLADREAQSFAPSAALRSDVREKLESGLALLLATNAEALSVPAEFAAMQRWAREAQELLSGCANSHVERSEIEDALWRLHSYESNRDDGGKHYSEADIMRMVQSVRCANSATASRERVCTSMADGRCSFPHCACPLVDSTERTAKGETHG